MFDEYTPDDAAIDHAHEDHQVANAVWAETATHIPEHVTYDPTGHAVPGPAPTTDAAGHPNADAALWQSQGAKSGLCGPTSIAMIINEFGLHGGGHPVTGDQVAQWALAHNEMTPDGTRPSATDLGYGMTAGQMVAVLDHYGVSNHIETGGNLATLESYLHSGRAVVLTVDDHQIWHNIPPSEDQGYANHAVVLTGIDEKTGWAYLNDPGSPDGRMEAVRISDLMSAWSASGNTAIVTDAVPMSHEDGTPPPAPEPGPVILPATLHHDLVQFRDAVSPTLHNIGIDIDRT